MINHGFLSINKPIGMTSHDVINQVRKLSGEKRVGHAGTLDPFAQGVLVVAVGREYTKQLTTHVQSEKEYTATLMLGYASSTDDPEGEITKNHNITQPSEKQIREVLKKFVGEILQTPPIYSAIKIKGKPAHRRVRSGEEVKLEPRLVQIFSVVLHKYQYPQLIIKVHCGKGVYIRSLARDIGKELNTDAYLTKLVRTRVGEFTIEQAETLLEVR